LRLFRPGAAGRSTSAAARDSSPGAAAPAEDVVGLDPDAAGVELARAQAAPNLAYVVGDVLTYPFERESFDLVTSVASLHHMDATAGLQRMAELLRPGGMLVVIGCARSRLPVDLPWELAAVVGHRFHRVTKSVWEHPAPKVWPPPETYTGMRRLASDLLPGVRYRRHLLWRYSLTWRKPDQGRRIDIDAPVS
jgi:SAM-dependent methyltransferase